MYEDHTISQRAKIFVENIVEMLDRLAPTKIGKIPRVWEGKKWFSEGIRIAASRRDKAKKQF